MPGIDTALDTLKGLGSGFLLSFFFPALLFTIVNLGLWVVVWGPADLEAAVGQLDLSAGTATALALLLQLTLAWILAPLSVAMRHLAEGELLPRWLRRVLLSAAHSQAAAAEKPKLEAMRFLGTIRKLEEDVIARLLVARAEGNKGAIATPEAIETACASVENLNLSYMESSDPAVRRAEIVELIKQVAQQLETALQANDADLERPAGDLPANNKPHFDRSDDLDQAHTSFIAKLRDACREAHSQAEAASGPFDNNYASGDIRPSRLGNLRAVMEQHSPRAYGVSFVYMWPRVQAALAPENPVAQTLERAKNQLDFAIIMWFGTIITAAAWLTGLALSGGRVTLFLLVGLIAPLLATLFYRMACEGQKALTEAVRATTDLTRLELLAKLGPIAPPNSAKERERWQSLQALSLGDSRDVELRVA